MSDPRKGKYKSVTVRLDDEMAAQLDRAMISFGLESRQQVAELAVGAWLGAFAENTTMQELARMTVEQVMKGEYKALGEFYARRAKEMGFT